MKKRNNSKRLSVRRLPVKFSSDRRHVITRFFDPGGERRVQHIIDRVAKFADAEVARLVENVFERYRTRHSDLVAALEQHYRNAVTLIGAPIEDDLNRRLLLGAFFTSEYSIESTALFNPSIVAHSNQEDLPEGALRFIMSLRATGEGHVSSVMFRTGVIYSDDNIQMDPTSRYSSSIGVTPDLVYGKELFGRKLLDIRVPQAAVDAVLNQLEDRFTLTQLEEAISLAREAEPDALQSADSIQRIRWLARSNYQLTLPGNADASALVIFPQTNNESRGIEDLRLVRFVNDDGTVTYYGTCTAFDGYRVLPKLMETNDFRTVSVHTLSGAEAQTKGMALFPRRVGGSYVMCSRNDGENMYLMFSDHVQFWERAELLCVPTHPWELVQIGNCGSPLETAEGWLLLTHGVGPMRSYGIGAMLLDLNDPHKVIGTLDDPLIVAQERERDGYVPNVVYTCGSIIHNRQLFIPYSASDTNSRFAMVSLDGLLEQLVN